MQQLAAHRSPVMKGPQGVPLQVKQLPLSGCVHASPLPGDAAFRPSAMLQAPRPWDPSSVQHVPFYLSGVILDDALEVIALVGCNPSLCCFHILSLNEVVNCMNSFPLATFQ